MAFLSGRTKSASGRQLPIPSFMRELAGICAPNFFGEEFRNRLCEFRNEERKNYGCRKNLYHA